MNEVEINSAIIFINNAIQDIIEGMSVLTKIGIVFTFKQRTLIKLYLWLGKVRSAQKLILKTIANEKR